MKALEILKELHLGEINTGRNIVELMQITNVQILKGGVSARYLYFCTYKRMQKHNPQHDTFVYKR